MASKDQEQLIDDQLKARQHNARKLFFKIYDNGFALELQGSGAEVVAPEGKKVTNKLASAVNGYRYELASLLRPIDRNVVADMFAATYRTFAEEYPPCRGIDLTPFDNWCNKAADYQSEDDYARMRYALMKAVVVGKAIIREGQSNPVREVEGAA